MEPFIKSRKLTSNFHPSNMFIDRTRINQEDFQKKICFFSVDYEKN